MGWDPLRQASLYYHSSMACSLIEISLIWHTCCDALNRSMIHSVAVVIYLHLLKSAEDFSGFKMCLPLFFNFFFLMGNDPLHLVSLLPRVVPHVQPELY